MRSMISMMSLLGVLMLVACDEEADGLQTEEATPAAESEQAVAGRGYCSGSGNPPRVLEPVFTNRRLPSKYCDNAYVEGVHGAVLKAGTNWAVCQEAVGSSWVVLTQGDSGPGMKAAWDWFDATSFSGGERGGPIPGLVNCSAYMP